MVPFDEISKEVILRITPGEKERKEIEGIKEKAIEATGAVTLGRVDYTLAGSLLRDTYMLDKKEFDIFLLFPESTTREALEQEGIALGKKIISKLRGTYRIAYAEHPYVRGRVAGFDMDIVPAYKVASASQIKSAVDRTPFHNKWLASSLKKEMIPEVRLLKQFLKASGLYGSDTRTEGFSGYLCEVLICYHKRFENLARKAAEWKPQVFIDSEGHFKGDAAQKFQAQPLVVIDPVDPERNVASPISAANFIRFCHSCRQLVSRPSAKAFFAEEKETDFRKIFGKRGTTVFAVTFANPGVIDDTLYPQLRKTANRIADILEENDFSVMGHTVYAGKNCYMIFELLFPLLPKIKKLEGPSIFAGDNAGNFVEKYRTLGRVFVESGKYFAETRRQFLTPQQKVRDSLSDSLKILLAKGFAGHVAKGIKKGYTIMNERQISALCRKDKAIARHLNDFFAGKFY